MAETLDMAPYERAIKIQDKLLAFMRRYKRTPTHQLPTVRMLARRFRCTQDDIIDAAENLDDLNLIMTCHFGKYDIKGEYMIEYIGGDP